MKITDLFKYTVEHLGHVTQNPIKRKEVVALV